MSDSKVNDQPKNPRNAARNAALASLQAAHRDEYEEFYRAECEKRSLPYRVRLTAEERAKAKADERLAKAQAKVAALKAEFGEAIFPGFEQSEHLTESTF